MDDASTLLTMEQPCDQAVGWLTARLRQAGFGVMRSFDLQSARQAQAVCPCPYHGTQSCDCQMVVLLVYHPSRGNPISVVAHGYDWQTWFAVVDTPHQRADPHLLAAIRRLVASQPPDEIFAGGKAHPVDHAGMD